MLEAMCRSVLSNSDIEAIAKSRAISTNILDFRVRVLDSLMVRAGGW